MKRFVSAAILFTGVTLSFPAWAETNLTDGQMDEVTAGNLVIAPLSDGRMQIWWTSNGQILSVWETSTNPNSGWTNPTGTPLSVYVDSVDVVKLPDGRLQLFAQGPSGLYTTQQYSTVTNSGWTNWQQVLR